MANTVKIAAIQMDCVLQDLGANLAHAAELVDRAASAGAKLIVLPELFNTGYRVEERDLELAETIPGGRTTDWMWDQARRRGAYLVGAFMERDDEALYDTAAAVGPEGFLGKYRKMYLWGAETERWGRGEDVAVIRLPFANIGLQICYEIGFPEGARKLAQAGAQIIVYTSAFGRARGYAWDLASRARALENGVFVLACNRCGQERDTSYGGLSRIVAPNTVVLAGAGADGEAVVMADIDLAEIEAQRQAIPYLKDLENKPFPHARNAG